jgi:hypothetical protein
MPKLADSGPAQLGDSSSPVPAGGACYLKICAVVADAGCPPALEARNGLRPLYVRYDAMPASISVCACGGIDGPTRDAVFGTWSFWPLWRVEQGSFSEHAERAIDRSQRVSAGTGGGVMSCALELFPEDVRSLMVRCLKEERPLAISLNIRVPWDPFDEYSQVALSSLQEAARAWNASLTIAEGPPLDRDPLIAPGTPPPAVAAGVPAARRVNVDDPEASGPT